MTNTRETGSSGEERAVEFLRRKGLSIIRRNYRTPHGEIDIVAEDGSVIVFVEVKLRRSLSYGSPESAVDARKRRQMKAIARAFISHYQLFGKDCRFDIVAIHENGNSVRLKHIENAFY
jgi:putative endonuclease